MKIERIETYQRFIELREGWNTLLARSGQKNPFLSHQWFDAWWQSFGHGGEMEILFFSDESGNPVGFAPLMICGGVLCFLANREVTDYCDFLSDTRYRKGFYRGLGHYFQMNRAHWSRMEFISIPESSLTLLEVPHWAAENGFVCEVKESEAVPVLKLPCTYDEYIHSLGRKNRHELRRKIRRLESLGNIRYDEVTESRKAGPAMEEFVSLHKESGPEKENFWKKPGMPGFFANLSRIFFKENRAELHMLYMEKKLIAALLSILDGDTVYFYNAAYDKEFSSLSPGFYLFDRAIDRAISRSKRAADFLRGGEKYKYFFGAEDSKIWDLILTAPAEKE